MTAPEPSVEIKVLDRAEDIEVRLCRSLRLPDGRDGAVWRGLVYPVTDGRIDVSGVAFPPDICRSAPGINHSISWTLIEGVDEAWLLVAGPASAPARMAAELKTLGISVLRSGRYLGDPIDDVSADWFLRFIKPPDLAPIRATLGLQPNVRAEEKNSSPDEGLRARLLQVELAQARARVAELASEVAHLNSELERKADRSGGGEALREAVEREHVLRAEAEIAREAAEQALADLSRPAPHAVKSKPVEELSGLFQVFLPRVQPLRDSVIVAATEFANRQPLYRALNDLQASVGRLPAAWKSVQGLPGWWERHLSDGQYNTGRLYGKFDPARQIWYLLISHKSEQARDLSWIKYKAE